MTAVNLTSLNMLFQIQISHTNDAFNQIDKFDRIDRIDEFEGFEDFSV